MSKTLPISSRPDKIKPHHLERWAIVYVRQSHPQQAQRHPESAQVQANLRHQAVAWGWPEQRIRVLDGDQGKSATTTEGRDDFTWLQNEITLGHVGLLMGFQFNRFAREDEACCRLIKLCALFDTLVCDTDGLYHPQEFNDRLVLTFKGWVGGIELHQIQQRMQAGRLNKARRGHWMGDPPWGYVIGRDHKLEFDSDEQVRAVVRALFEQFGRLGSISALLRYLKEQQIQIPIRSHRRETKGQLEWHRPHRSSIYHFLRHPAYAGIYTWEQHPPDARRVVAGRRGTGRHIREPHECSVYLPDNHAAYITAEQYQAHRRKVTKHRQRGPQPGPARDTVSLLAGLVVCGFCGCRMQTRYTTRLRYDCQRRNLDYGAARCQNLVGQPLEELVAQQILRAVAPASLELSLAAIEQCEHQRAESDRLWQLRLERAQQDVDRAFRQYDAVEPENRLAARTLEVRWEAALLARHSLQEEYDRFRQQQPLRLTAAERSQLEALARDLPALWSSPQTTLTDKRHIVRLLLTQVVVWAPATSEQVTVECHWAGDIVTRHQVTRSVRSWKQLSRYAELLHRITTLRDADWKSDRITEQLNREGFRTPSGVKLTAANVRQLLSRQKRSATDRTETSRK
jgi:DNA invertase Pin-like site-specific DNA recombinase